VELKRRAEIWEKALADGNFDALEEAISSGGPTFAQVTCQVETPPTKSQHDDDRGKAENADAMLRPDAAEIDGRSHGTALEAEAKLEGVVSVSSTSILTTAATASVLTTAATAKAELSEEARARKEGTVGNAALEIAIDDDEDDLLAAAARDSAGEPPLAAKQSEVPNLPEKATALPGCSTAWSLEMLDAPSAFPSREATDALQPATKRLRLSEE
jgi:hypothetical protein